MASGGSRENAGRKKIGLVVNTRIDDRLIGQIERYIDGSSRAEKIRKCLVAGIEQSRQTQDSAASDAQTKTIVRFFGVYTRLLDCFPRSEDENIDLLNAYLLGFFTGAVPSAGETGVGEELHLAAVRELGKFSWSLNEGEVRPNTVTPGIVGSVFEKLVNRRDTGSYYTPRDTTDYISAYSIVFSLLNKCGRQDLTEKFFAQYGGQSEQAVFNGGTDPVAALATAVNALGGEGKGEVFKKISSFTVLDPTCGTGAFLIAAADILVRLYRLTNMCLFTSLNDFVLGLFRNCLHGVDILGSALSFFRLRSKLYLYRLGIGKRDVDAICFRFYRGDSLNGPHCRGDDGFDWAEKFPEVLDGGGFDCIIGNPPYVETAKAKISPERLEGYRTRSCGNLYAHIFENAFSFLKENGYMGMIVPISFTATQRMQPLRDMLLGSCSALYIANFSDRPACLFAGVHQKLSIVFAKKAGGAEACGVYTSSYRHWAKSERARLFGSIRYLATPALFIDPFGIAKVGDEIKCSILRKVAERPFAFSDLLDPKEKGTDNSIYLNQRMTFWAKCFSSPESSKEYKEYRLIKGTDRRAAAALINSSLFYLLWEAYSDCWHVTRNDLDRLRFDRTFYEESVQNKLAELQSALERKLYETRQYIYSKQTEYIYVHRNCRKEIAAVDDAVAELYGFSEEERMYIAAYNEKYRMSVSSASEEE